MMNNFMQNNNQGFPINRNQNVINKPMTPITPPKPIPPPQPIKPGPISFFAKPTLIGLNNIGSTCCKNAVLECLSQTRELTNYFLKEDNLNKIINNNLVKKKSRSQNIMSYIL